MSDSSATPASPDNDPSLWQILPTDFTDQQGRRWCFKKLSVNDLQELEAEGLTTDKIIQELGLVEIAELSHRYLRPIPGTGSEPISLHDYKEILVEDVLDAATEAFRRCLTNFFPRARRIAIRKMFQMQEMMLMPMAEMQARMYLQAVKNLGKNLEPSDSPSGSQDTSESNPGDGPSENSVSPLLAKPELWDNPIELSPSPNEPPSNPSDPQ